MQRTVRRDDTYVHYRRLREMKVRNYHLSRVEFGRRKSSRAVLFQIKQVMTIIEYAI